MKPVPLLKALWCAAALAVTAGCGTAPPAPGALAAAAFISPPAALRLQGVPALHRHLADDVAPFADVAGHAFVDWHPQRREMLVSHRAEGSGINQLFRLTAPLATAEPLTDGVEPVSRAWYEPRQGQSVIFMRGSGGDEAYQLYRLDPPSRQAVQLTEPGQRHSLQAWLHHSSRAIVASLPLDRTAAGGSRSEVSTRLWLMDPARPGQGQPLASLPGGGWSVGAVSPDDSQAALRRYLSANESEVWLIDLASGQRRQLLPKPGTRPASHQPAEFTSDGGHLYVTTDTAGEFQTLNRLALESGLLSPISAHLNWDVEDVTVAAGGGLLALQLNVDGRSDLRLVDARTLRETSTPALPSGSLTRLAFHRQHQELAFSLSGAQGPNQVFSLDLASGRSQAWTRPRLHPALDTAALTEQQVVRWTSFDGRSISGLLSRPPARFAGRRPVLINIHGGPEAQARVGFAGRNNYLLQALGVAILQPNVRGSSGYGKTFLGLDNGFKREDAVKDIGALLDWIATQPDLDPQRVVVAGGSYGGYMSLAVAAAYAGRIAGAIDVVGISHFSTFLQRTESYRRDLRRVEYGDERDPAMRAFHERIAPLNNAHRISKPLLVVQGRNDPRVPYTEAEQIVARVRENGTPVWYLLADNEGHGFARKDNADFQFYTMVEFLRSTLLAPDPGATTKR